MPGMKRKPGKGDGSYSMGKPAKPAKATPGSAKAVMRKMTQRGYKRKS